MILFIILYIWMLYLYIEPAGQKRASDSIIELSGGLWELNVGPLQEQPVLPIFFYNLSHEVKCGILNLQCHINA